MISTQFLLSCLSGDEQSIELLVRTHQRGVFQLALSILDDSDVAPGADPAESAAILSEATAEAGLATRETFIAALDRLPRYREDTPFDTWLYALAIKISQRRARRWRLRRRAEKMFGPLAAPVTRAFSRVFSRKAARSQTEEEINLAEPAPQPAPDPHFLPGDAELWSAVRGLDERLRLPVVLRYYHDFSITDISRLLHLSEGAVHARLDQAREKIARSRA